MNTPVTAPATAGGGGDDEVEEFSDEFKCCVCLDLIYKPVVLACGHISCFWCVFEAMDIWQESRCPVCRHAYNHFPSICWLLHSVLLKLYPEAYQRRESQVKEEEKINGTFSPEFENHLAVSHCNEQMPLQCHAMGQGEDGSVRRSLDPALSDNNCTTGSPTSSSDKITKNVTVEGNCLSGNKYVDSQPAKQVPVTDLLCAICKELLCRPVVLNCGHVFCEACIINSCNEPCRCPVCRSMHPNGFPKVCLVLEGFLEQHVSEEYAARRVAVDNLRTCEQGSSSTVSTQVPQGSQCKSVPMNDYLCSPDSKVHFGVGCDCCGMYPLIGDRYRCKDCLEEIGFDLCGDCYNSSSNLPGRFNQQHKPDHKFEVKQPRPIIILPSDYPENHAPHHPENRTNVSIGSDWHDPENRANVSIGSDWHDPENRANVSIGSDWHDPENQTNVSIGSDWHDPENRANVSIGSDWHDPENRANVSIGSDWHDPENQTNVSIGSDWHDPENRTNVSIGSDWHDPEPDTSGDRDDIGPA